MAKKTPEVESEIQKVLAEVGGGKCLDTAKERKEIARAVYEMLCHEGYLYVDYDKVSDHAEDFRNEEKERAALL